MVLEESEENFPKKEEGEKIEVAELEPIVLNKQAFLLWKKFSSNPILSSRKYYTASDGTVVNLSKPWMWFVKDIDHLPEKEQLKIRAFKNFYHKVLLRASYYKRLMMVPPGESVIFNKYRLLEQKKQEIIELFSRMYSVPEIHKIVVEDWKMPCGITTIYSFRKKYAVQIAAGIVEFKRNIDDIRLGVKKSRLEELTWMYLIAKDKFKKGTSNEVHRLLLATLEQIRKEVEGDKLLIEGGIDLSIENRVNYHLQKEALKELSIQQIILSRVASKQQISLGLLLKQLSDSFYSKFIGLVGEEEEYEEGNYPSQQAYDFNRIQENMDDLIEEAQEVIDEEESFIEENTDNAVSINLKETLLNKLLQHRDIIIGKEIDIDRNVQKLELLANEKEKEERKKETRQTLKNNYRKV